MLPKDAKLLVDFKATPAQVADSWQTSQPIVALIGNESQSKWSRWSIIAPADGKRLTLNNKHAINDLGLILKKQSNESILPNWIGYLSYELGYTIEPSSGTSHKGVWPLIDMVWCDRALIHDAKTNTWWSIGECEPPNLQPPSEVEPVWSNLKDDAGKEVFKAAVARTVDYIHAGDIFQANITRRFSSNVRGNIRSSAFSTLSYPGGWFGAWLEFPDDGRYIMSMSPELFLQYDGKSREIITRPMKGTRPECDNPQLLIDSQKDAAELHMIVDLMRNDLGRICEFGSIEVRHARTIEQHPTVWQCVGEICGKTKHGIQVDDILKATFPAGSITGAPKIRAMQIIQKLEPTPRGPYCGAIGIFGKSLMLNVAIRTALFHGNGSSQNFEGRMEYSTGCGIVAESDPEAELLESEVKTHILQL